MIAEDDSYEEPSERIDTLSTAPTVLIGFDENSDRMLDVRPYAHIPGKRKAPRPPPKGKKAESNYERFGQIAKVNRVQKLEDSHNAPGNAPVPAFSPGIAPLPAFSPGPAPAFSSVSPIAPVKSSNEGNLSPRSWFRKNKKDMTIPNKSKSNNSNSTRPISLLASISDFDRQAAKIVEQRLKDEEKRKRVNDESFYVSNNNGDHDLVKKEPQEAIDEIMVGVEQKMECLDAIGKHNDRWEKRISNDIPNIDMNGLVSDLNQFLNTTKKELMTPKTKRKKEIEQAKQQVEEESKQVQLENNVPSF